MPNIEKKCECRLGQALGNLYCTLCGYKIVPLPPTEGWITDFEDRFSGCIDPEGLFVVDMEREIISFIRTEIQKAREEGYKEGYDKGYIHGGYNPPY